MYGLALAGLCIASARPMLVSFERREHATIILAIDSSRSMLSTDVRPTRLGAAKLAAETFLNRVPAGFRVGIVSFSGRAHVLNPPTVDRENLRAALQSLSARPGTAIGDALAGSLRLLPKAGPVASDVIVLLTDGNNTAGSVDRLRHGPGSASRRPLAAAGTASAKGVRVYTVAVGTKKAPPGSGVSTRAPNLLLLAQIAAETGGATYSASSSSQLNDIYSRLGGTVVLQRILTEITWGFIAAAALLALLGAALAGWWLRRIP
jgi:Ca-activated chloride channel family protein